MSKKCNECGNESSAQEVAQLKNQVADLNDIVQEVKKNINWILYGHPILLIDNQDDIDLFNFVSGEGSGRWAGWAVMGGYTIYNPVTKKNVTVSNWTDRFIVMAGGSYSKGDKGGSATVQLTAAQNGIHSHAVTDPGHDHSINDPGHDHNGSSAEITPGVTLDPHNHTATQAPHTHTSATSDGAPDGIVGIMDTSNLGPVIGTWTSSAATPAITVADASVSGSVMPFTPVVNVGANTTGIAVQSKVTGISVANSGNGQAHENRPPYYASVYIQKLW